MGVAVISSLGEAGKEKNTPPTVILKSSSLSACQVAVFLKERFRSKLGSSLVEDLGLLLT